MATGDGVGTAALSKASWRLLPLLFLGYGIAYVDRLNIAFAALQMNQDLHFSDTVYGLGGGLFFLSYACCEVPSNLLLLRFGARRWIARIMLTWGLIAAGMMFVETPTQFYVMRFLLGAAEAGFFPGVLYYLSEWFPAAHRGRAISRFYFAFPISAALMGALAGPLLGLKPLKVKQCHPANVSGEGRRNCQFVSSTTTTPLDFTFGAARRAHSTLQIPSTMTTSRAPSGNSSIAEM